MKILKNSWKMTGMAIFLAKFIAFFDLVLVLLIFFITASQYTLLSINRKFCASRRIREHVFYSLVRYRADPLKIRKIKIFRFNQNFTKWLNILSSTVISRLIFEFTLQISRILSIIIKFWVRPPPRPFGVTGGATTRFLSCNIIRQTKTPKTPSFYNA
jgi:hypothetical protein